MNGLGLLGPEDLLSVPKEAVSDPPVALEFEGTSQPISAKTKTGGLGWLKPNDLALKEAPLPKDRLRASSNPEKCLLVADSAAEPRFVSENHLKQTETGWILDAALSDALPRETWHGAAVVSVEDGKVIGLLLVPEKGAKRILPLTTDLVSAK